ncbi:MAG TPA: trimethylamine methyltransferase family protein [Steroidobacteraceae bacterium]|nr:trimethylamine methyltransferase family protein [Steroidobacteraceae bacterium]
MSSITDEPPAASPTERRSLRSGRDAKRAARAARAAVSVPYIKRAIPRFEVLSEGGLETIERNADTILAEIGIEFREDAEALALWQAAGADVQGARVRFERGMCRELIRTHAPREFEQVARNPARSVHIGGDCTVFAPAYGSPFIHNLDEGRRYARLEDFENFVKLAYLANSLHHSGGTICEPVDLPVNKRHLDMVYAHVKYSDKPFMGSVTAPERAADSVELAKLAFGPEAVDPASGRLRTMLVSLINVNSPLVYDATMLGALKVYARANQATIVTPFILSGAMSPVTVAGTAAQTLAEAMAGMAFAQLVNPGCPVVFGSFASSISMQSGAPTFGTPEPALVLYTMAALARRLGVPFRSGGSLCAAKVPDAQAAFESAQTLLPTCLAGVNFVLHTAGWLEGGLAMGYEKFMMDVDQAGMMHTLLAGVDLSPNGQALDAIADVGPGNHFLGCAHTQANFESAFYRSPLADNNSFEQWQAEGSLDMAHRANAQWKRQLAEYVPPPLDRAVDEALLEYIAKRKAAAPDSNV